jgi:hypothetical protein
MKKNMKDVLIEKINLTTEVGNKKAFCNYKQN